MSVQPQRIEHDAAVMGTGATQIGSGNGDDGAFSLHARNLTGQGREFPENLLSQPN